MSSFSAPNIILSTKNYYQMASNVVQGYVDKYFEGKFF